MTAVLIGIVALAGAIAVALWLSEPPPEYFGRHRNLEIGL